MATESLEQIYNTLAAYDPDKTTLTVGGAAIGIHLGEAGVDPGKQSDVDVLCTKEYFAALCSDPTSLKGVGKFQIRWPYGSKEVRALSPVVDIYPAPENDSVLPFSACEALGGIWYPVHYKDCIAKPEEVVTHNGYTVLAMAKCLIWAAYSGRDKDFAKIERVLPIARELNLITDEEYSEIELERDKSIALRREHPHRYHARID